MNPSRHSRAAVARHFGSLAAVCLFPAAAIGQVPVIPRAEPVVESAAAANNRPAEAADPGESPKGPAVPEAEAPAAPATVPEAETPDASAAEPEAGRAAALAALVGEDNAIALVLEVDGNGSDVFVPVASAKASGLTAARWKNGVMRPYSREEFRALGMEWKEFRAQALETAESHLDLIEPVIDRDARGTAEVVRFVSESPLTATCLFTAGFRDRLEDVLGVPFYAVAPSRSVVLAFAKSNRVPSAIRSLAPGLFNDSIYPASPEIFEVDKEGVRVIGTFKED